MLYVMMSYELSSSTAMTCKRPRITRDIQIRSTIWWRNQVNPERRNFETQLHAFFLLQKVFNDIELKELVAAEKFPSHIFNSLIGTRCGRLRQSHTQSQFQGRSQEQKLELELNPFLFLPNPPYFRVRIKSPLLGVTKCAFQSSPLSLSLILLS